jgi:hypothetical protein
VSAVALDRARQRAAEWDCVQLIHRFYACLDESDYDELVSLFAPSGAWVRLGQELVGPEAIRAALGERTGWLTAHVVTNVLIVVTDEGKAHSRQYVTLYRHEGWDPSDGPAAVVLPLGVLIHRDQLIRHEGLWKFQRKTSRAVMVDRSRVSHYEKGAGR